MYYVYNTLTLVVKEIDRCVLMYNIDWMQMEIRDTEGLYVHCIS